LTPSRAWPTVVLAGLLLSIVPGAANAQAVEVAPSFGYRVGGDLYGVVTGTTLDGDAASYGVTIDVFVREQTSVVFLYSRQQARIQPWGSPGWTQPSVATIPVDHWHLGGSYDLDGGRLRPFLAATAGLTRFGVEGGSEVRFSAAGHAGVKLLPSPHIGARLDARLYAVWVDGGIGRVACANGLCAFDTDILLAWQGEVTAALLISF
jgi:hypothetical protein